MIQNDTNKDIKDIISDHFACECGNIYKLSSTNRPFSSDDIGNFILIEKSMSLMVLWHL